MNRPIVMWYDRDGVEMLPRNAATGSPAWLAAMKRVEAALRDREWRVVQQDDVGDLAVSTVWLGLDHQFDRALPPLIFETAVLARRRITWMRRYSTIDDARAGHAKVLAAVRGGVPLDTLDT